MVTSEVPSSGDFAEDAPSPDRSPDGSAQVRNTMSGAAGVVLQAGVVHGEVHLHAALPPPAPLVPQQLPAAPGPFAGRVAELSRLDRALTATAPHGSPPTAGAAVLVSAIGGAGGIGKTWLALAWAHHRLERFPDGQLFVDLHGFSPVDAPVEPAMAVRGFLDALGVAPGRVPADLGAQTALYRSLLAGRRMLIVLDNAATAEQVVPLLPGSPTCTVLVTGRHRLASLIDRHGARHLSLDGLSHDEARTLLTARLGAARIASASAAVDELIRLCGGHPLALSITARNVDTSPGAPLAEVAAELRELGLEAFDHDTDPAASLPTVLSWSLRRLTDEQRVVFSLLGIAPGPDTTPPATAALTRLSSAHARRALAALEGASLVERRPGGRYAMHDLVRRYAADTAEELPEGVREVALTRVVDFHLHTAYAAERLLAPHRELLPPGPPAPGVRPSPLPDAAAALAWLDVEYTTLLAAQRTATARGRHDAAWHLAWNLHTFQLRRGHRHDMLAVWRAALNAAPHLPDPTARSRSLRFLGRACSRLGLHEQAIAHLDRALDLAAERDDPTEQALTHRQLATAWDLNGDGRRALEHARRTLHLYRSLDKPVWEADALNAVGWYAARVNEFDTAYTHCRAALPLFQRHHERDGEANTLDSLGYIAQRRGEHQQALDHYHRALALYRDLGHAPEVANTLDHMGHPHAALGQHAQARARWEEALELYLEQGREEDASRVRRELDDARHVADDR
ncbi:Tetratricopeptide TPR_2 repeat protein [Actinosynnema mirum DSM 43827]|uniref:Tetratricopeptide TPR_2 repeat protein n=2 Tax=Actinosynnema mirum TaxID=40567 RepID=C6WD01_ACTMD|nr:Tetratricopeptide TPR_2 repeat protein [Actinosynnema mirum DSM 43827]